MPNFVIKTACWRPGAIFNNMVIEIMARISKYTRGVMWNVIPYPCPNFNIDLTKPPLKLCMDK